MYNQISNLITTRADKPLEVKPTSYPASPLKQLIANIVSMVQMSMFMLLFANDKVLPEVLRENKMFAFFGIFMFGQMVSSTLLKTEAFEIYMGRKLVWSSLSNQRMPNLRDLVDGFQRVGVAINAGNSR